jgi:hypothetical protein
MASDDHQNEVIERFLKTKTRYGLDHAGSVALMK